MIIQPAKQQVEGGSRIDPINAQRHNQHAASKAGSAKSETMRLKRLLSFAPAAVALRDQGIVM